MNQLSKISRDFFSDLFKDVPYTDYFIKPLYGMTLPESFNLEVRETPDEFSVQAELPGVTKDDINVSVDGNALTISTEIKQVRTEKENEQLTKSERYYGRVSRALQLPSDVDESRTVAHYENGILTLTLPKVRSDVGNRIMIT